MVATQPLTATNPAIPGFAIELAPGATGRTRSTGTVQVAELSAAESAQHMLRWDWSSPTLLYKTVGLDLTQPGAINAAQHLRLCARGDGQPAQVQPPDRRSRLVRPDGRLGRREDDDLDGHGHARLRSGGYRRTSPAVRRSDNGGGSLGGGSGLQGGGDRRNATGASIPAAAAATTLAHQLPRRPSTYSACLIEEPGPTNNTPDSPCPLCDLMGGLFGSLDSNTEAARR